MVISDSTFPTRVSILTSDQVAYWTVIFWRTRVILFIPEVNRIRGRGEKNSINCLYPGSY